MNELVRATVVVVEEEKEGTKEREKQQQLEKNIEYIDELVENEIDRTIRFPARRILFPPFFKDHVLKNR